MSFWWCIALNLSWELIDYFLKSYEGIFHFEISITYFSMHWLSLYKNFRLIPTDNNNFLKFDLHLGVVFQCFVEEGWNLEIFWCVTLYLPISIIICLSKLEINCMGLFTLDLYLNLKADYQLFGLVYTRAAK